MSITITSADLEVTFNPLVGGTITAIIHSRSGASVLGTVPWDAISAPVAGFGARDESEWLTRYTGGWPLLFPNGGDACTADGVFHGFHGEASIAPWRATATADTLRLTRNFFTVPVEMNRELCVHEDVLIIRESLHMHGASAIEVMWGHHATFGSTLLAGEVEITSSAQWLTADAGFDPATNPMQPGARGAWPRVPGKSGIVDMSRPRGVSASLAYFHGFDQAWAAIRRLDNTIAVALSWDAALFPCAWLWHELEGTLEAPWHGRGLLIGIEPCTTMPALGIEKAKAAGGGLLRLHPGEVLTTSLRLHVFKPTGTIRSLDSDGRCLPSRE